MDSGDSFIDFADSVKSLGLCRVWARFFGFVFAVFRRFLPFAVGFMPCAVSVALSALCGFYFAMFGGLFVVVPAAFLPCLLAVVFSVSRLPAFGRLPWLPLVVRIVCRFSGFGSSVPAVHAFGLLPFVFPC